MPPTAKPAARRSRRSLHARRQLEELKDRIRCQLDDEKLECLDEAFGRIVERLDRCGHERGCCCDGDCDYDDVGECDPDDVHGRLAVIEHRTKEAADCFWDLIREHTVPAPAPRSCAFAGSCALGCGFDGSCGCS